MFRGSMVAMVTPFRGGKVAGAKIRELVKFHIENGTDVLVPCGTTGESATLSFEEHERVIKLTISAARGRIPVIAGTGSNNTAEAIRLTKHAKKQVQAAPYLSLHTIISLHKKGCTGILRR